MSKWRVLLFLQKLELFKVEYSNLEACNTSKNIYSFLTNFYKSVLLVWIKTIDANTFLLNKNSQELFSWKTIFLEWLWVEFYFAVTEEFVKK